MVSSGTSKPYVKFIGQSAIDVTQSCYQVRFKKYNILLDCGGFQGIDIQSDYNINKKFLKKIKPREIDYIILHEIHSDHTMLVPALYAKGCQAHIYVPYGSKQFLALMWEDSVKIMQSDCQKLNNNGIKAASFYSLEDVEKTLQRIIEIDEQQPYRINQDIILTYYPSNHIIHANQTYLNFIDGNIQHKLLNTGDVGGEYQQPYAHKKVIPPFADLVIAENTYNQPKRVNKQYDRQKDIEKIATAYQDFKRVLIGTFSLNRCQTMLTLLYDMWQQNLLPQNVKIIVDAPLAQKICNIWPWEEDIMNWDRIKFVQEWAESQAIQQSNEHAIIISTSNFLNGGRIRAWLQTILPNRNDCLIFSGYSGQNNLASQIRFGERNIVIDGVEVENNANIIELTSMSSHASYEELLDYYCKLRYNKIALVHGDMRYKPSFCNTLQDRLHDEGKSAKVVCTQIDQKIYF